MDKNVQSVLIALGVSTVSSAALYNIFPFWQSFLIITAGQFIIGSLMSIYVQYRAFAVLERERTRQLEEMAKQSMPLTCPCVKNFTEVVPLRLDYKNEYNCGLCNVKLCALITARTALKTDIVDVDATQQQVITDMNSIAIKTITDE